MHRIESFTSFGSTPNAHKSAGRAATELPRPSTVFLGTDLTVCDSDLQILLQTTTFLENLILGIPICELGFSKLLENAFL